MRSTDSDKPSLGLAFMLGSILIVCVAWAAFEWTGGWECWPPGEVALCAPGPWSGSAHIPVPSAPPR